MTTSKTRAEFEAWLDEPVDWSIDGQPIRRRVTMHDDIKAYSEFGFIAGYQAARRATLEEAAKVLEARIMGDNNREDQEAKRCAAAIRALGDEGMKL